MKAYSGKTPSLPSDCHSLTEGISYSLQWLPESLVHMQIFINQGGINPAEADFKC